jgi:hypothetical protein
MSQRFTWRMEAAAVISEALEEGRAQGLEGKSLARFVSKAYPFGERTNYPYKVWLHEFERQVKGVNVPYSSRARQKRRRALFASGQTWLFDPFGKGE